MSDSLLSQNQIEALLKASQEDSSDDTGKSLTAAEKDTIGELGNIAMGSAATVLSTLLSRKVEITTPRVSCTTKEHFVQEYPIPCILVDVRYTEGLKGRNVLIFKEEDASIIADLMLGRDGKNPKPLEELEISAVAETMNQMMGSATTSMSSMLTRRIAISPPEVHKVNLAEDGEKLPINHEDEDIVEVEFMISVDDLIPKSQLRQLIPVDFARELVSSVTMKAKPVDQVVDQVVNQVLETGVSPGEQAPPKEPERVISVPQEQAVTVDQAQFAHLEQKSPGPLKTDIDIILDVPLKITVELGRTELRIRQVLELGPGSIVELDKLAGEPVDVLVNGKLIAKGEVVVIDEDFGVKITDIVSQAKRLSHLAEGSK